MKIKDFIPDYDDWSDQEEDAEAKKRYMLAAKQRAETVFKLTGRATQE